MNRSTPLRRRRCVLALGLGALTALAGCASPVPLRPAAQDQPTDEPLCTTQPTPEPERTHWSGRLALSIETEPVQHFSANFELWGNADSGSLSLSSPLGQRVAHAQWDAQQALLLHNGRTSVFAHMDELSAALTGVALPLPALFAWLRGQQVQIEGWQADLSRHAQGRLQARRWLPTPAVELRLILH
jgi:outer membrane lipoprotein LolB